MNTDKLTGLPNRDEFVKFLSTSEFGATDKESWLALVDIDTFTWINYQFGHVHGDQLLIDIGKLIQVETKSHNLIPFRVGGDEFAIVGVDVGPERFSWIMQRLQQAVSMRKYEYRCNNPNRNHLTVSIGICPIPKQKVENSLALVNTLADRIYEEKTKHEKNYEAFYAPSETGA